MWRNVLTVGVEAVMSHIGAIDDEIDVELTKKNLTSAVRRQ